MVGRQQLRSSDVQQHPAAHERRERVDAVDPEAGRCLHTGVDMHAAVKDHVLGLVRQSVDVRARVLGHDHEAGCARARLGRAARVVPMQEIVEARGVGGVRRRAGIARLLEIEDPGGADRFYETRAHSR